MIRWSVLAVPRRELGSMGSFLAVEECLEERVQQGWVVGVGGFGTVVC